MNVTLYCFVIATPNPKRFRYKIDPALWPNEPVLARSTWYAVGSYEVPLGIPTVPVEDPS